MKNALKMFHLCFYLILIKMVLKFKIFTKIVIKKITFLLSLKLKMNKSLVDSQVYNLIKNFKAIHLEDLIFFLI